jgi:hypothetical protein
MGNAPAVDLICRSPQGKNFSVQVKSLSSKSSFIFSHGADDEGDGHDELYFVLVLIPTERSERAEYYLLNRPATKEALVQAAREYEASCQRRGTTPVAFAPGVNYSTVKRLAAEHGYRDAWERTLPA